ncbi:MAG: DNA mismatch repair endonuclease MutL [Rikenellaceae bacterium]|jgi:DNA mismatch repair protein MutL|nr:DNA mismatch repair endonuclease MutL [Rikenellaceae bacterium]
MSARIKLLSDAVANQIAAGEVVNRPASVVKELVENSVDAGAGAITVNFRDGGRELIQIKDDGVGMSPTDARMAFERHATSKIASVEDIYALGTFGFRGEALASIAAVAQVEMQTRQAGDELGVQLFIDGGVFRDQRMCAVPQGTQIFVRNLFYNLPARKKFLDKATTEATHILTEFQRVALCHPEIAFQLYRDDAPVYNLPADTLFRRIVGVMGKAIAPKLLEVSVDTSLVRVSGFVSRPSGAKQRNKEQFLFVNGRFFKSPFFHKAIIQAFDKLIPQSVQPSYFLYFDIDPEAIDVNVHPQKTEVKFTSQSAVWQIINAAVRETLAKSGAVPMMDFDSEERIDIPVLGSYQGLPTSEPRVVRSPDYNPFTRYERGGNADLSDFAMPRGEGEPFMYDESVFDYISSGDDATQSRMETLAGKKSFSGAMNLGEGLVAAVYGGSFVVVDVRRAREAVLYDDFNSLLGSSRSISQQLLFPERMALSTEDFTLLEENTGEFAALGFDLKFLSENSIEVAGTPAEMPTERIDEVVYEILDTLRDDVFAGEEARRSKLAAIMARSAAGTAPLRLSAEETTALLDRLARTANPSYTPWGRPVMTEITLEEIRNKLK